jgi:manganese efflux pump family protein
MDLLTTIAIAAGLSIDAFVVSVTGGATIRPLKFRNALKIALAFGLFQAFMPVIGWAAGVTLEIYIREYDHWVAFGLLTLIGGRMIYNALSKNGGDKNFDILKFTTLLLLAIATSIDALAIGFSFALLDTSIIRPVLIIGAITFSLSLLGVYIGNRLGSFFEKKLELAGGIILILIGIRILMEHLIRNC